ncbi:AAA family ATPase [Sorangium sp. So ce394]|uniref:AAA family ATPase n=1 Tax=Sorangium sp. So ce394 TaxID=3133310 RepID=UPI003F5BC38B
MTWRATREDLWTEQTRRAADQIRAGKQVFVHGGPGYGKSSVALQVARALGPDAVFVQVPPGADQVEHVVLTIAHHAGPECLVEVDQQLSRSAGQPAPALDVLGRALARSGALLVIDDVDALGNGMSKEIREVVAPRLHDLRAWLSRHAVLSTGEVAPLSRAANVEPVTLDRPTRPPCSIENATAHDVGPLWSAAYGDPGRFGLAVARTVLSEDVDTLVPGRLNEKELLDEVWSLLTADMADVLLRLALHGRPVSRDPLARALPGMTKAALDAALDAAERALLVTRDGQRVAISTPSWEDFCVTTLPPERIAEVHRDLALAFSAGIKLDDPRVGLRAVDIVESVKHFVNYSPAEAKRYARYGVTMLIEHARALSLRREFERAERMYADVLDVDAQLRRAGGDGIGPHASAYARHYFHYNRHHAQRELPEETERGYESSLTEWKQNATFWSNLALLRFRRGLPDRALDALDAARKRDNVPDHKGKERELRVRTVDHLLHWGDVANAVAVWGDYTPESASDSAVERRLQAMLTRGFRARVLRVRGQAPVFFHRDIEITIPRAGREYACQARDLALSARGPSPKTALAAMLKKLRTEVADLLARPTHTLSREKITRKGLLLSLVDLVASGLLVGTSDEVWVVGWLERLGDELLFVDDAGRAYALAEEFGSLAADNRLRFARVGAGAGGQPVGPVRALEEPFSGDPDELLREFQQRVGAHG